MSSPCKALFTNAILLAFLLFSKPGAAVAQSVEAPSSSIPFADGDRILFLGDSITQDGRYISMIETYLWARYPAHEFTIINMGVSAETVSNTTEPGHPRRPWVHDRIERALEISKPDWVFVCYGMNDGNYFPPRRDIQQAYAAQLERLLERIKPTGAQIVLLSPPPFDPLSKPAKNLLPPGKPVYGYSKTYQLYDDTLIALGGLALGALGSQVEYFIDIHTPIQNYITSARALDPSYKYGDGVHPPTDGHLEFALAILEGLGEKRDVAYDMLHKLTGITLVGQQPSTPPRTGHKDLLRKISSRFRTLSRTYRDQTRPETHSNAPNLVDRLQLAKEEEAIIRARIQSILEKKTH